MSRWDVVASVRPLPCRAHRRPLQSCPQRMNALWRLPASSSWVRASEACGLPARWPGERWRWCWWSGTTTTPSSRSSTRWPPAELVPSDIAHPVRAVFRRAPNVTVRMAEVTAVDPEHHLVHTRRGVITYDRLILAPGSVPHFFGVEGAEEHAFPLRWMSEAVPLRHHVLTRFEVADACTDLTERRRLLTFVIVGGGATGVEFAGALAELVYGPLRRDYPRIGTEEVTIHLLEAGGRLLPTLPERLGAYAERRLTSKGVRVRTDARVCRVRTSGVELEDGTHLPTDTVVWTAGIRGDPRAAGWGLPVGPGGRVRVDPYLRVEGVEDVFVVGDLPTQEPVRVKEWAAHVVRSRVQPRSADEA